jgi:hypothetical protein
MVWLIPHQFQRPHHVCPGTPDSAVIIIHSVFKSIETFATTRSWEGGQKKKKKLERASPNEGECLITQLSWSN